MVAVDKPVLLDPIAGVDERNCEFFAQCRQMTANVALRRRRIPALEALAFRHPNHGGGDLLFAAAGEQVALSAAGRFADLKRPQPFAEIVPSRLQPPAAFFDG